uniref:Uncharacterized protein n=1 Tax=Setaria italica TaxID=4555 RepID=K4A461_SETIT
MKDIPVFSPVLDAILKGRFATGGKKPFEAWA